MEPQSRRVLEFRDQASGLRVQTVECRFQSIEPWVQDSGLRFQGVSVEGLGLEFRVQGLLFTVQGLGYKCLKEVGPTVRWVLYVSAKAAQQGNTWTSEARTLSPKP